MSWRGAILAFYSYGMVISVGGSLQMLTIAEKAIFGDRDRLTFRVLLGGTGLAVLAGILVLRYQVK